MVSADLFRSVAITMGAVGIVALLAAPQIRKLMQSPARSDQEG